MENSVRRLTRSQRDRVFAGVCGGLAGYFVLDPVLVRVLYIALTILSWGIPGILLYVLAWIIIPLERDDLAPAAPRDAPVRNDMRRIAGIFFVVIGLLALLSVSFGWFGVFANLRLAGPIVLLAVGVALLIWRREPENATAQPPAQSTGVPDAAPPVANSTYASEPRRLTRSEHNRKIAGVCAGLGEYLNIDPTIVRLLFIAAIFAGGAGIILYLIMWLVVPLRPDISVPKVST